MKHLHFSDTHIKGGFWKYYSDMVRNVTAKAVYDRFWETGRFDAFRCDWEEGMKNRPHRFWDSDVAKWIEGVAYLNEIKREPEFEKIADETIELIEKNQYENGYFNSYYIRIEPDNIFKNRDGHELYTTGHLIEAAIAYDKATGKDKFLKCMIKNVDHIYKVFVEDKSAAFNTPGHQEIELALLKLYDYTKYEKALSLAQYFIENRGKFENDKVSHNDQTMIPLRELKEVDGHCVRAGYLFAAMAKLANLTHDEKLFKVCDNLFNDITEKKMSITGGIGYHRFKNFAEAFSYAYDLPNLSAYNETCASIALALFAHEMLEAKIDSKYADIIELINFNGFISGVSLSGDEFFYSNPLEIDLKKHYRDREFQGPSQRVKVFECSCCPPNVVRMLSSIQRFMYSQDENVVYCHQFADSETKLNIKGINAVLIQKTDYPYSGKIDFTVKGADIKLKIRIPSWCTEFEGTKENGYITVDLKEGESFILNLPMNIHFIEANPNVQDNSGRYALMRGPVVYCMEGIDNGENLRDITILENGESEIIKDEYFPAPVILIDGERRENVNSLYKIKDNKRIKIKAKFIPYLGYENRGDTDMIIWTQVK